MQFKVTKNSCLISYLKEIFSPAISMTTIRSWLQNGLVQIDGKTTFHSSFELKKDQNIFIFPRPKKIIGSIKIFYEDSYFIVIEKPTGLLSVPTDHRKNTDVLHILRKNGYFSAFPVHRLDRETSGVMLFAKNKASQLLFKKMFETHDIIRKYYAIVEGQMKETSGIWENYLKETPNFSMKVCSSDEGVLAITHFEVMKQFKYHCFVTFFLQTGKKHQIRVQSAFRNHCVAGDKKYGAQTNPIKRLSLHASFIGFSHPVTGKAMRFSSPLPLEFQKLGAYDDYREKQPFK